VPLWSRLFLGPVLILANPMRFASLKQSASYFHMRRLTVFGGATGFGVCPGKGNLCGKGGCGADSGNLILC